MKKSLVLNPSLQKTHNLIAPAIAILLSIVILFTATGMTSAHAATNPGRPTATLHITLPHNVQDKFPSTKIDPNVAVTPKSVQCQFIERQTHFGTVCFTYWQQCILGLCVPVGVDINLSQGLVDYIAAVGSNAVAAIVGAIVQTQPVLAPFSSAIQAAINISITTIVNFAKSACGGTGVGINIGFPSTLSLHC